MLSINFLKFNNSFFIIYPVRELIHPLLKVLLFGMDANHTPEL